MSITEITPERCELLLRTVQHPDYLAARDARDAAMTAYDTATSEAQILAFAIARDVAAGTPPFSATIEEFRTRFAEREDAWTAWRAASAAVRALLDKDGA